MHCWACCNQAENKTRPLVADASLSFVSVTGRGVGLKMVALADNLVEISTQLPRLEEADATEERCVLSLERKHDDVWCH